MRPDPVRVAEAARATDGVAAAIQRLLLGLDRANLTLTLRRCLGELFGIRRLEGKGTLVLTFDASGDSVLALTRTVNGLATLTARQGDRSG